MKAAAMGPWEKHIASELKRAADQIERDGRKLEGVESRHDVEMRKQLVQGLRSTLHTMETEQ